MFCWVFVMHFFVGYSMITNDSILSSDELIQSESFSLDDATGFAIFEEKRYQTKHAQAFLSISLITILISFAIVQSKNIFGTAIENKFIETFFKKIVEDESTVSNDYYDLMSAKYLTNEYERTKAYLDELEANLSYKDDQYSR